MNSSTLFQKQFLLTDEGTNCLFLSDLLPARYPLFFQELVSILDLHHIPWQLLPGTKDIWCRDYMPVQVEKDRFVQFTYEPSYLMDSEKWSKTITDTTMVCQSVGITPFKSTIKIDGGNIVKGNNKVLVCDRIFSENNEWERAALLYELEAILQTEVVILPTHPGDPFGHADGTARWYDDNTVLINSLSENRTYSYQLIEVLSKTGLFWREVPVNFSKCKEKYDATGLYLNFLEMGELIILPSYGLPEDEQVLQQFYHLYPTKRKASLDCTSISREGGVLNCISWNVY